MTNIQLSIGNSAFTYSLSNDTLAYANSKLASNTRRFFDSALEFWKNATKTVYEYLAGNVEIISYVSFSGDSLYQTSIYTWSFDENHDLLQAVI